LSALIIIKETYLRSHWIVFVSVMMIFFILGGCTKFDDKDIPSKKRIISLAPHITEIIYALDAQDQLIAVTDYCRYPEDASSKQKIGGLIDPNIEKMVTLKPTQLFGLPSHEKLALELSKFGLTVTMMPNENMADVRMSILKIGDMIGHSIQAKQLVRHMDSILDSLRDNREDKTIPGILMIGREKGTLKNITVAGSDTYMDQIWKIVGGENSYADLPIRYGTINLESLLLRDPQVIIEFDMKRPRGVYRDELSSEWEFLKNLQVVQKGNIFVVGGNHTLIPGPRLVLLAQDFGRIIDMVKSGQ
jgi:iron complex transport system substrate-binding protein